MPTPVWPLSITRGPPRKADILLDTTCFSTADLGNLSDFVTDSDTDTDSDIDPHHPFFDLANPTMVKKEIQNPETHAEGSFLIILLTTGRATVILPSLLRLFLLLFCNLTGSRHTSQMRDRKSTRLNSSHSTLSRMPSSA